MRILDTSILVHSYRATSLTRSGPDGARDVAADGDEFMKSASNARASTEPIDIGVWRIDMVMGVEELYDGGLKNDCVRYGTHIYSLLEVPAEESCLSIFAHPVRFLIWALLSDEPPLTRRFVVEGSTVFLRTYIPDV